MSYSLRDYNKSGKYGGKGDSGRMSESISLDGEITKDSKPKVGECIKVGSYFARTMSWQDWWMTSPVEEILEEYEDEEALHVKFKTKSGTLYHWKKFK